MGLTMRSLAINVFLLGLVVSLEFNDSEVSNFNTDATNSSSFALDFSTVLNSSLERNERSFQAVPEDTTTTKESVPGSTKVTNTTEMTRTLERSSFLSEIDTGNFTNTTSPLVGEIFAEIDDGNEINNGSSPVLSLDDFRRNSMSPYYKDDKNHNRDHDHRDHEHGGRDRHAAFFVESDNSTNASSHLGGEFFTVIDAGNETNNESSSVLNVDDFRKKSMDNSTNASAVIDLDNFRDGSTNSLMSSENSTLSVTTEIDLKTEENNLDSLTDPMNRNPEPVNLNTDFDSLRNAKAAENEMSDNASKIQPWMSEFMELQENGTLHTGVFNISSSLTQPSGNDDIEDKAVSELGTDPPAKDFWGFKNTFSKFHPWVGWFVGVPSSTDSSIDISETDATTELPREMKLLINSGYGHNLLDLNGSESVELGNSTVNSDRDTSDGRSLRNDVKNGTIFVASENGTDYPNRDVEYGRSLSSNSHEDWVVNNSSDHVHNESCGVKFDLGGFNASFVNPNSTEDERHQRSFPNISHEDWMVTNTSDHVHNESCGLELDLGGFNDVFVDLRANITDEREMRSLKNFTYENSLIDGTSFFDESLGNVTKAEGRSSTSFDGLDFVTMNDNIFALDNTTVINRSHVADRPSWSGVANLFSVNGTESPLDFMVINLGEASNHTDTRKERQLDLNETSTGNSIDGRADEEIFITTSLSLDVEETSTNSLTARTADVVADEATDAENSVTTDSSLDARTGFVFDKNSIAKLVDESFDKSSLTEFLHKFPTHKPLTLNDILDKVPTHKPLVISKHELSDIIHKPLDKPSLDHLLHKDKPEHDHHHDHDHIKPSKHSTAKPASSSFKPDHHHDHDHHHHKSSTTSKPTVKPTTTSTTTMKPTTTSSTTMKPTTTSSTTMKPTTTSSTTMKPTTTSSTTMKPTTTSSTTMKPTTTSSTTMKPTTTSSTTMKPTTTSSTTMKPTTTSSTTMKPTTTSSTTMKPTTTSTTTMKSTTTSTTTMKPTTTYKPKTSTYKSYPPQPYSYHPDVIANIGVVDDHQEAGMSPPVFARPHEDRYAPDNYQEVPASNNYGLEVSGYSAPVFAKPADGKLNYECPSYLARHPCPIWLMEKDPHCDTHIDCQKEYPMSMCCLYNCRRRCIGNVHPYEVQKQRVI